MTFYRLVLERGYPTRLFYLEEAFNSLHKKQQNYHHSNTLVHVVCFAGLPACSQVYQLGCQLLQRKCIYITLSKHVSASFANQRDSNVLVMFSPLQYKYIQYNSCASMHAWRATRTSLTTCHRSSGSPIPAKTISSNLISVQRDTVHKKK